MSNLQTAPTPAPATQENKECAAAISQQLTEAEELTNELKRLLVRYESTLEQEGIRHHIETLERWMETYRHGMSAARKISENGTPWLTELRERLKLAAEELQRLEGEGGNPATKEQVAQAEDLMKASRRIDQVIPNIEQIFSPTEPHEKPKEDFKQPA